MCIYTHIWAWTHLHHMLWAQKDLAGSGWLCVQWHWMLSTLNLQTKNQTHHMYEILSRDRWGVKVFDMRWNVLDGSRDYVLARAQLKSKTRASPWAGWAWWRRWWWRRWGQGWRRRGWWRRGWREASQQEHNVTLLEQQSLSLHWEWCAGEFPPSSMLSPIVHSKSMIRHDYSQHH